MKRIIAVMLVVAVMLGAVPAMAKMSSIEEGLYHMAGKELPEVTAARHRGRLMEKQHRENYARVHAQAAKEGKVFWAIVWVMLTLAIVGIPGVIMGIKKEVVYFYGGEDLAMNLVPILILIGALFVPDHVKMMMVIGGFVVSLILNFLVAYICNPCQAFMAASVGAGRVVLGYLAPIILICVATGGSVRQVGESSEAFEIRSLKESVQKAATLAGMVWFMTALVNGTEVEQKRIAESW